MSDRITASPFETPEDTSHASALEMPNVTGVRNADVPGALDEDRPARDRSPGTTPLAIRRAPSLAVEPRARPRRAGSA